MRRPSPGIRTGWRTILVLLLLLAWGAQPRPARAYEQRRNTISLGFQGGGGLISGSGTYRKGTVQLGTHVDYDQFDLGTGVAFHVRYSLDRNHAIGFTFEDLRFDRKSGAIEGTPKQYQINNFLAEYYLYFHRRAKVSRYIGFAAGFHRPTFRYASSEDVFPGEGFTANLGGGLEYFLTRPFSLDGSIRAYYLGIKGGSAIVSELMLGIHYYLLR
jgi:hypothetical protein